MNEPIGRLGSFNACARADNCFAYCFNGFILPYYTLVQAFFQMNEFFAFAAV